MKQKLGVIVIQSVADPTLKSASKVVGIANAQNSVEVNMKLCTWLMTGLLVVGPGVVVNAASSAAAVDSSTFAMPGTRVSFQVEEKTQVPGRVLKGGVYSLTVIGHLSDRMVMKVVSANGKEKALFLAVPSEGRIPKQVSGGPILMRLGAKTPALRGFAFPNGAVAEFVYPKAEAVALAKENSTSVPAIDPESEGRLKSSSLSEDELGMVTLWLLTPTFVAAGQPAIAAERLQVAAATVPPPPGSAPQPSTNPAAPSVRRQTAPANAVPRSANSTDEASVSAKPHRVAHPIATLPHTAGDLSLWIVAGSLSFFGALALACRRVFAASAR